ncbi:MAG: ATP-binding cassette domain-containing protein [Candidatus Adiutrix sp.]|jgi:biotin transport system ATP-binding protein|nr:ATP-binding cassette domain-containing protein [Candidatus Adiutrix sp.]
MLRTLTASNLCFSYEPGSPVLKSLSFECRPGRILGLAGANGSGKSTLLNLLAGLLSPDSGELRLGEERGPAAIRRLRREAALLPQNLDHWLLGENGREDLELGLNLNDPEVSALTTGLISRWGLEDILDRPVESLSLGQKKRLALAAALARRPGAMLLDEPLSGLDWPGVKAVLDDLARLKEAGALTVLITHEPTLTRGLVDDWLLLRAGGDYLYGPDLSRHFEEFGVRPF